MNTYTCIVWSCFFTLILLICPFTIYELRVTMIKGVYSLECIQWTSSRDGKYRSHCYEYFQGTNNSTFEAEATCKIAGGQLAPFVDELQYNFWRHFLPTHRYRVLKKNHSKCMNKSLVKVLNRSIIIWNR